MICQKAGESFKNMIVIKFWDRVYETKILSLYLSSASSNIHIKELCTCFVEDDSFHLMDSKVFCMYE